MASTNKLTVKKKSKLDVDALLHSLKLAMVTLQLVHESGLLDKKSKTGKALAASSIISGSVASVLEDLQSETGRMNIEVDIPTVVEASKTRGLLNAFADSVAVRARS